MNILVIEDDEGLRTCIAKFLALKGHQVNAVGDGVTGLHLAVVNSYDAIVLDLSLPGIDGLDVCARIRSDASKDTPVLMLTGRSSLDDKLAGFDTGADDYMVKPIELEELLARLTALSKRVKAQPPQTVLKVGDLSLNLDTLEAKRANQQISLTPIALRILETLMQNAPHVVKREQLEKAIWQKKPPSSNSLQTHIHYLRDVIDKPFDKPLLHTVHGIGYRMSDATDSC
ncbi:MAG: response regulator transcription factor [Pseudomonadota bacterium]